MLGAENRGAVTCYLDSLLFAMFAKLESFECMLKHEIDDPAAMRLAALLRLWVNMLRTGKLIEADMVSGQLSSPGAFAMSSLFAKSNSMKDTPHTRCLGRVRMERCPITRTARYFGSIWLHYRDITITFAASSGGPLPPWQE